MGFRPTDNTFIIRHIFEKSSEHNTDLHIIFVDYKQAFDSLCINKIIACLPQYKVPEELIRLIVLTLINSGARAGR